jgi:hypothetical protein
MASLLFRQSRRSLWNIPPVSTNLVAVLVLSPVALANPALLATGGGARRAPGWDAAVAPPW